MESSFIPDSKSDMLADDLFEGWLSVPVDDLFRYQPDPPPKHVPMPIIGFSPQLDVDRNLTCSTGADQDWGSYASPSVSSGSGGLPVSRTPSTPSSAAVDDCTPRKRRVHTKSRLGCINCKKRKVKCQETWPSCANCLRRGCLCRYPTVFRSTQHNHIVSEVLSGPRQDRLSDTSKPSMYNANDMRLFHHYLIAAHPCIPHEYEVVWVRDVPRFSYQYSYLMDAILALSASHLNLIVEDPRLNLALSHRQKAIEGLEEAFTRWPPKPCEAHVMLATSYLLAFQSSYLPDGMLDHILSLRGCAMLSQMIFAQGFEGVFPVDPNRQVTWFEWKMVNFPALDQHLMREALRSLADFAPVLAASKEHKIERDILAQLVECVRPLLVPLEPSETPKTSQSSMPGYTDSSTESKTLEPRPNSSGKASLLMLASTCEPGGLLKNPFFPTELVLDFDSITSWDSIADIPQDYNTQPLRSFNALVCSSVILTTSPSDPVINLLSSHNVIGNIVMAHFYCTRYIIMPISAPDSTMNIPAKAMIEWVEKIIDLVQDEPGDGVKWTKYIAWPRKIITTLRCYLNRKKGFTVRDSYDTLVNDSAAYREGRGSLRMGRGGP